MCDTSHVPSRGLFVTCCHESGLGPAREGKDIDDLSRDSSSHISKVSLVREPHYAVLIRPFLRAPFCLRAVWKVWLLKNPRRRSSTHLDEFLRVKRDLSIYGLSENRGKKALSDMPSWHCSWHFSCH